MRTIAIVIAALLISRVDCSYNDPCEGWVMADVEGTSRAIHLRTGTIMEYEPTGWRSVDVLTERQLLRLQRMFAPEARARP